MDRPVSSPPSPLLTCASTPSEACGVERVTLIDQEARITPAVERALGANDGPRVMVIKTETGMPEGIGVIPMDGLSIRDRFIDAVGA